MRLKRFIKAERAFLPNEFYLIRLRHSPLRTIMVQPVEVGDFRPIGELNECPNPTMPCNNY
ncbi:hypothetical protein HCH_01068 [Hahella chejuensis KCTC 2396]|uniref:Uncharacterized protein n=1 Tax=Hahella chejuensis (strain KCTC 2396) TaxID=349521 RepID=Q2SN25_HAHCH|nr:hypothetical protein HCH_01068 [Hahella chejuensis KCTC 2396]